MTFDPVEEFVAFSLDKPAQFGAENFAGDPDVEAFFALLVAMFQLDVRIYVSWESAPDVSVVQSPFGNAVLRSERLDPLLVEFHQLTHLQQQLSGSLADDVAKAAVLRWMSEFLIGYRQPALAVEALRARPKTPGFVYKINSPFRDETLASIPRLERAAIQCFSLGHEIGHVAREREQNSDLSTVVDGLPMISHLDFDLRAANATEQEISSWTTLWHQEIDAPQLLTEVRADLFAFDIVCEWLHRHLHSDMETAVRVTLEAFQAQLFVYHCKEACRLLAKLAVGELADLRILYTAEHLADVQLVARGRAVTRRAGLVWATLESNGSQSAPDYNEYVRRVDEILLPGQGISERIQTAVESSTEEIAERAEQLAGSPPSERALAATVAADSDLVVEIYEILIAFGCSGDVDVVSYLTEASRLTHKLS